MLCKCVLYVCVHLHVSLSCTLLYLYSTLTTIHQLLACRWLTIQHIPLKSNPPLINSVCRVATLRMAEDKVKDELYEMSKPLARYADDEDLERMLKERERDGDPMLKFIKKKPKLTPTGKPKKGIYLMSLFLPPFSLTPLYFSSPSSNISSSLHLSLHREAHIQGIFSSQPVWNSARLSLGWGGKVQWI